MPATSDARPAPASTDDRTQTDAAGAVVPDHRSASPATDARRQFDPDEARDLPAAVDADCPVAVDPEAIAARIRARRESGQSSVDSNPSG